MEKTRTLVEVRTNDTVNESCWGEEIEAEHGTPDGTGIPKPDGDGDVIQFLIPIEFG